MMVSVPIFTTSSSLDGASIVICRIRKNTKTPPLLEGGCQKLSVISSAYDLHTDPRLRRSGNPGRYWGKLNHFMAEDRPKQEKVKGEKRELKKNPLLFSSFFIASHSFPIKPFSISFGTFLEKVPKKRPKMNSLEPALSLPKGSNSIFGQKGSKNKEFCDSWLAVVTFSLS